MRAILTLTLAGLLGSSAVAGTKADPGALGGKVLGTPVSCLTTTRILDTDPVDERTILFFMKGGKVYRNDLDQKCRTVTRNNIAISYSTTTNRLCSTDVIRLFDPAGGIAFGHCGLGKFTPYQPPEGVTRDSQ